MSSVSAPDVFDQKQTEICPNHRLFLPLLECLLLPLLLPISLALPNTPTRSASAPTRLQISWCLRAMRGMPAAASFKFQLAFNDLMPSLFLSISLSCSAGYAQPLSGWGSSSSWHTTRSHVATVRRWRQRTSGSDISSSRGSGDKSQRSGLTASPAGTLTLWPAWLRFGAAHALAARRSLQAVG